MKPWVPEWGRDNGVEVAEESDHLNLCLSPGLTPELCMLETIWNQLSKGFEHWPMVRTMLRF